MAATPYLVQAAAGFKSVNDVNSVVVNANSTAEAKAMAAAYHGSDSDARWNNATVTSLATDPNDWGGYVMRCIVTDPVTPFTVLDVSVTGVAADDFATFVGRMVTALNATAINGAAFNTDTLKVAETTDGMGDWSVQFFLTHPNGAKLEDLYVSAITHNGASGAALTVALVANGTLSRSVAPTVQGTYS